jgi:hypothetical protein
VLVLKIIFKNKNYYFNIFLNKNIFLKKLILPIGLYLLHYEVSSKSSRLILNMEMSVYFFLEKSH